MLHEEVTSQVINAFYTVYNTLGCGFLEKVLNYLKATEAEVGLILNFGPEAKFSRRIYTNDRKRGMLAKHPLKISGNPSDPLNPCPIIL